MSTEKKLREEALVIDAMEDGNPSRQVALERVALLHLAADEIQQLQKLVDTLLQSLDQATKAVDKVLIERDEARDAAILFWKSGLDIHWFDMHKSGIIKRYPWLNPF